MSHATPELSVRPFDGLTLAVPKGRLHEPVMTELARCGFDIGFGGRDLVTVDAASGLRLILVRNSDVPAYVGSGTADLGVCGSDLLAESIGRFFRLHQFAFGGARVCVAGPAESRELLASRPGSVRVATTLSTLTRRYFHDRGWAVEVIELGGSVELAPELGLAPLIVDIVETGGTLRAHSLEVLEEVCTTTVHLIANQASYKFWFRPMNVLVDRLRS